MREWRKMGTRRIVRAPRSRARGEGVRVHSRALRAVSLSVDIAGGCRGCAVGGFAMDGGWWWVGRKVAARPVLMGASSRVSEPGVSKSYVGAQRSGCCVPITVRVAESGPTVTARQHLELGQAALRPALPYQSAAEDDIAAHSGRYQSFGSSYRMRCSQVHFSYGVMNLDQDIPSRRGIPQHIYASNLS